MNSKPSLFRSLTRLTIGGLIIAIEELNHRIPEWEKSAKKYESIERGVSSSSLETHPDYTIVRDGAIGFFFEVQDRLGLSLRRLDWITRRISDRTSPMLEPITQGRVSSRVSSRLDKLANLGQTKLDHWIERGRLERANSRSLLLAALDDTVEQAVDEMSTRPEVLELVQGQSVTMAGEIVEEIRERSISTDNLLDTISRRILRRSPRKVIPEPGPAVKKRAEAVRQYRGRIVKR
jgi:hypothetical protein